VEARAKALLAAEAAEAKLGEHVVVLDVQEHTPITDYFVIASGTNRIQIRAITDAVQEAVRDAGEAAGRTEGRDADQWVLLDFGDVVVHIFAPIQREYYGLERLWGDAAIVER
jgi:ribosome-associated protein